MSEHSPGQPLPEGTPTNKQLELSAELETIAYRVNDHYGAKLRPGGAHPQQPFGPEGKAREQAALNVLHEAAAGSENPQVSQGVQEAAAKILHPHAEQERRQLLRNSLTDSLTGAANRKAFQAARGNADADPNTSFLMLDGDRFGLINKKLGHDAGDAAMIVLANAVAQAANEAGVSARVFRLEADDDIPGAHSESPDGSAAPVEDAMFRIGGDEFVVLGEPDKLAGIQERAEALFASILDERETIPDSENQPHATAPMRAIKLGISGEVAHTFLEADDAMQKQKAARKQQEHSLRARAQNFIERWRTKS